MGERSTSGFTLSAVLTNVVLAEFCSVGLAAASRRAATNWLVAKLGQTNNQPKPLSTDRTRGLAANDQFY